MLALALLGAIFDGEDKNKNLEESVLNLTNEINNKTTEIERLNNVIADLQEKLKNCETKIEEGQKSEETSEIEEKDKTVKMTTEEIEEMAEKIEKKLPADTKMFFFIASLKKDYEGLAKVDLDKENKIIKIIPEEDLKKAIEILIATEDSESTIRKNWDKVVNDFKDLSKKNR